MCVLEWCRDNLRLGHYDGYISVTFTDPRVIWQYRIKTGAIRVGIESRYVPSSRPISRNIKNYFFSRVKNWFCRHDA